MARGWLRVAVAAVALLTTSGITSAAAAEPERSPVGEGAPAAGTPVPLPDLGFAHRAPDGGINLIRMPLSELEYGYGRPHLVRKLTAASGFRFDRARVVAGDFADIAAGDDGSADHVIWHSTGDGSVKVWAVGGGTDTAPRLWHSLSSRNGWNWAVTRPYAADVNGDGWDDLLVVHRLRLGVVLWLLPSDGHRLGAPRRWGIPSSATDFRRLREVVADVDRDGNDDLVRVHADDTALAMAYSYVHTRPDGAALDYESFFWWGYRNAGWSFPYSRQLAGDVTGDGTDDLVTIQRSSTGGVLVRAHRSCATPGDTCWPEPTELWQNLGAWPFAYSRQYLADTNGDRRDDLITVQSTSTAGVLVWRHVSTGAAFSAPRLVANLPSTGGWNWWYSRETVADTWGVV